MDSQLNLTGVYSLGYLSNKYVDIVLIGEEHCAYNPYETSALHEWINTDITMQPDSFIFCEDINMRDDLHHTMYVTPRYFRPINISFMDSIRHSFGIIDNINDADNITRIYNYVNDIHEQSPILQTPVLHDCVFNGINTKCYYDDTFINKAATNELYSLEDTNTLNIDNLIKDHFKLYRHFGGTFTQKLYHYELLKIHYLHYNFIYTVVNWIKTHKQVLIDPDVVLWNKANRWLVKNEHIDIICTNVTILDYMFIINTLNTYSVAKSNKKKYLIWVPAGGRHTDNVFPFLKDLFNYVTHGDEKFTYENIPVRNNGNAQKSITDMINMYPNLGFKNPKHSQKSINIAYFEEKYKQNASLGKELLRLDLIEAFPYCKRSTLDIINRLFTRGDLPFIVKVLNMINDKSILKPQLPNEFEALLSTPIDTLSVSNILKRSSYGRTVKYINNIYAFTEARYYIFTEEFTSTYIPMFKNDDQSQINIYKMCNFTDEPSSVNFSRLKRGENILLLPNNNGDVYEDVNTNSAYFHICTLAEQYNNSISHVANTIKNDLLIKYTPNREVSKDEIEAYFKQEVEKKKQKELREYEEYQKKIDDSNKFILSGRYKRILEEPAKAHIIVMIYDAICKKILRSVIKGTYELNDELTKIINELYDEFIQEDTSNIEVDEEIYKQTVTCILDDIAQNYNDTSHITFIKNNFDYSNIKGGEELLKELQDLVYKDINQKNALTGGNEICFRFGNIFLIAILIMVVLYMMYVVYHIHLRKSKCNLRYRYLKDY